MTSESLIDKPAFYIACSKMEWSAEPFLKEFGQFLDHYLEAAKPSEIRYPKTEKTLDAFIRESDNRGYDPDMRKDQLRECMQAALDSIATEPVSVDLEDAARKVSLYDCGAELNAAQLIELGQAFAEAWGLSYEG